MATTTIRLNWSEMLLGGLAGLIRRVNSLAKNLPEPYGWDDKRDPWSSDIRSACAEMAVAKHMNRYWVPADSAFSDLDADVGGNIHVRSTRIRRGSLILHDRDKPGWYVLVIDRMPEFDIAGWIHTDDGIREEFYRDPGTGRPAYFVPQGKLTERIKNV